MDRSEFAAGRIREVFLNGKWIANTNYKEQLAQTSFETAIAVRSDLNSIAALTFHINYYLRGLLDAFKTGTLTIRDKFSFDLPPISSEEEWRQLVDTLLHNAEAFAAEVAKMPDTQLDQPFIDEKYGSFLRNIEGVIEHSYYHLGQIVILRKMLQSK
ncbi:DinB family protein [Niabella insulamsoli]|uniref:DinB family protein n=1 Tax=Niabella insulamsoli TaxID=3144874 RepID=UPI0031FD3364